MHRTACPLLTTLALALPGAGVAADTPRDPEPRAVATPQATPAPSPAPEASTSPEASDVAVPTRDVFDVIRAWRHKPEPAPPGPEDYKKLMIAGAPVISYNPASGAGIGAAGNVAFYRGAPDNTRISSLVGSLIGTTKEQLLFNAKIDASTPRNVWGLHSDNRLYWTSQDTYGLGTATTPDEAVNARYDFFRFYETVYRQVRKQPLRGRGLPLRPALRRAPERGRRVDLARLGLRGLLDPERLRPRLADLGRLHRARAVRQPRQLDQPQPRLLRERRLPEVLRGLPGRQLDLADRSTSTCGRT